MIHLLGGAIVGDDGEAVVVHVHDEVLAHDGQSDEGDVSLWFHKIWKSARRISARRDGARVFSFIGFFCACLKFSATYDAAVCMKEHIIQLLGRKDYVPANV